MRKSEVFDHLNNIYNKLSDISASLFLLILGANKDAPKSSIDEVKKYKAEVDKELENVYSLVCQSRLKTTIKVSQSLDDYPLDTALEIINSSSKNLKKLQSLFEEECDDQEFQKTQN